MNPSQIKPIDKTSVHRICSGQVVLNLAVAVKELIENSLDAGATIVNVRLKQYGSELLEVTDNGSGVHPDNFEGLTLKHHTSKLRDFSDLESVATFGFRGEALSSLCALSKVSISTRHKSQDVGTCLTFQHTGAIASTNYIPRQVGTTVSLANLFSTLPVRQKEFHRNLKKEFQKMSQLLNAYCLVSTGVKITCTNQTNRESKHVSTLGCPTVKENISSVFGPKQLTNLLELKTVRPSQEVLEEMKIDGCVAEMFNLEGFISSCAHGCGRAAGDRQFYYINSRPCELSKVTKAVNEVYHQYNIHQVPFVFMNILVERNSVDVNVTPDKRQVFLDQEKLLIATIKASLTALYEKIPSTYTVNNLKRPLSQTQVSSSQVDSKLSLSKFSQFRHKNDLKRDLPQSNNAFVQKAKQMKLDNHFTKNQKDEDNNLTKSNSSDSLEDKEIGIDSNKTNMDCVTNSPKSNKTICDDNNDEIKMNKIETTELLEKISDEETHDNKTEQLSNLNNCEKLNLLEENLKDKKTNFNSDEISKVNCFKNYNCGKEKLNENNYEKVNEKIINSQICNDQNESLLDTNVQNNEQNYAESDQIEELECDNVEKNEDLKEIDNVNFDDERTLQTDFNDEIPDRKTVNIEFNIDMLKTSSLLKKSSLERVDNPFIKFRSTIDPSKNSEAEQELSREITKEMFSKMDIVGQFNLGFIITKLGSDLFIVDQHATDEKYNFETLQQTTTLSNQKLVVPQNLELTAANECILLDNLEVFKQNGFEFKIDENEVAFKKVKLSAIPMSKNWIFGKEDIDELIFMLQDVSPGTMCRPSRVRSMFASRACRMSVMIGSHLSLKDMRKLIDHMGQIEQPWNCPHGRPTMRHLINLELTD